MNPETNRFEELNEPTDEQRADLSRLGKEIDSILPVTLIRPDGSPVPATWDIFSAGELIVIKKTTFKVVHIGENYLVMEPAEKTIDLSTT